VNPPASRKRKSSARARAALAWSLALLAGLQIGVHLLLKADPELGDAEFGRKLSYLRATLAANPGRPLILTLGSSRMATAFRPDALPELPTTAGASPVAFNFAMVGTGPEMSHLVLHRLLAAGIRPAWVFVEYWPPFWTTERRLYDFRRQIDIGRLDVPSVRLLGGYLSTHRYLYSFWIEHKLIPIYAYRSVLLRRFAPGLIAASPQPELRLQSLQAAGWWSPRNTANPDYDRQVLAEMLAHYRPILKRSQSRTIPDRALRATLDLCRRNQIHATVIVLPEGDEFRKIYPAATLARVDEYLARIQRECAVSVLDAREWIEESAFMDSHHLFPTGATQFTRRLGAEILAPQVARGLSSDGARRLAR
jgi:hypothetical protein